MDLSQIKILDSWGDYIGSTMLDQLMVANPVRLAGGVFNGTTPDTNFYESTIAANATATISGNTLTLATTVDSGSSVLVNSQALARYVGANMNAFRSVSRFGDTGTANNTRQIGVINGSTFTDGFYFQLSGTTFSVVARTGSSDTKVDSGSFNGDVTSWTVNNNYHTFEILYTNKSIDLYIDRVLIHSFTETTSGLCNTRHLKPFVRNYNTGVGSVVNLNCQVMSITRYGSASTQAKTYLQEGTTTGIQLKIGPGSLHLMNISAVSNNSVITIYDGTSTSGRKIWTSGTLPALTQPFGINLDSNGGTPFDNGLFLTITGANATAFVKYE